MQAAGTATWRARFAALLMIGTLVVVALPLAASGQPSDEELFDRGGEVFQAACAACHGTRGEGGLGSGDAAGPPLRGLELAYIDMTVRTGRMPIPAPELGVYEDRLSEDDRIALASYAERWLETTGDIPDVGPGSAAAGQETYVRNCAACHGAAAGGGISGASAFAPPLVGLDGVAIASATRVGPFEMPAFGPAVISDQDIDDIVSYVEAVGASPPTAIGLREVDQAVAGLLALGLGLPVLLVVFIVARARRWHPGEPGAYHEDPPFEPRP
jgi:ubiquinol-cytochrome c reductase cytochrome c subunit